MTHWASLALLLVLGLSIQGTLSQDAEEPAPVDPSQAPVDPSQAEEEDEWGLNSVRGGFEAVNGYFDSMLELMGGRDGVCQYRCRYGKNMTNSSG